MMRREMMRRETPEARKGAQYCQLLWMSLDFQLSLSLAFYFEFITVMSLQCNE